jgi:hypothetical protein
MKLALFALLAGLAHAAPTKRQDEADDDDGVISLDLTYTPPPPPIANNALGVVLKAAKVPHHVP